MKLVLVNLPICGIALLLVIFCLKLKSPQLTSREKLARMDWFNLLFIASATSAILGLTWGGVAYEWSSYHVLSPLILGLAGIVLFVYLERFTSHPTLPYFVLAHWNSIVGNILCFLHSITVLAVLYYYPIYLQSVIGDSAVQSGVHTFNLSLFVRASAFGSSSTDQLLFAQYDCTSRHHQRTCRQQDGSLQVANRRRVGVDDNWSRIDDSVESGFEQRRMEWVVSQNYSPIDCCDIVLSAVVFRSPIIVGFGAGILYSSTNFSVLAPLKPSQQPQGSAFYALVRAAGQVVGISIGSTILQNRLAETLPSAFAAKFGGGEIAFAAIPVIKNLSEPLRSQVRSAFADSIRTIWIVTTGIAGVALLLSLSIQNIPLTREKDEAFGFSEEKKEEEKEKRPVVDV